MRDHGNKIYQSMDWFSWENLHRKPMGFYHQIDRAFRFQFSHHPMTEKYGLNWIDLHFFQNQHSIDIDIIKLNTNDSII